MNNQLLLVAFISIAIGIFFGILIVLTLQLWRRRQVVDSLIRPNDVVGLSGIVEIPFDSMSQGKVRLNVKGSLIDFTAFTDQPKEFTKGEQVFVVGMRRNKVWVVAEDSLENHPSEPD